MTQRSTMYFNLITLFLLGYFTITEQVPTTTEFSNTSSQSISEGPRIQDPSQSPTNSTTHAKDLLEVESSSGTSLPSNVTGFPSSLPSELPGSQTQAPSNTSIYPPSDDSLLNPCYLCHKLVELITGGGIKFSGGLKNAVSTLCAPLGNNAVCSWFETLAAMPGMGFIIGSMGGEKICSLPSYVGVCNF